MISVTNLQIPVEATSRLDKIAVNTVVADVADGARNHWIKLASRDTSSFRIDYINGIQPVQQKPGGRAVISLVGEVPHLLEDGANRLDMRDTLLGPNVPVTPVGTRGKHLNKKEEYYRAIPLRQKVTGSSGTPGITNPYTGNIDTAKKLGRELYKKAKGLAATTSTPYGGTTWGGRLDTSKMDVPLLRKHHKSDIYMGMIRQEKIYEKSVQSTFMTFRTISESEPSGWIRKPIIKRDYASKVNEYIQKILPKALEALFQ